MVFLVAAKFSCAAAAKTPRAQLFTNAETQNIFQKSALKNKLSRIFKASNFSL